MKNMKFNILLLFSAFLLLAVMPVTAQQKFHIVSFDESPLDMTARDAQHEKIDGNGDRFAIVKVTSTSADDDLRVRPAFISVTVDTILIGTFVTIVARFARSQNKTEFYQ